MALKALLVLENWWRCQWIMLMPMCQSGSSGIATELDHRRCQECWPISLSVFQHRQLSITVIKVQLKSLTRSARIKRLHLLSIKRSLPKGFDKFSIVQRILTFFREEIEKLRIYFKSLSLPQKDHLGVFKRFSVFHFWASARPHNILP